MTRVRLTAPYLVSSVSRTCVKGTLVWLPTVEATALITANGAVAYTGTTYQKT